MLPPETRNPDPSGRVLPENTASDDRAAWMALHLVPGLGSRSIQKLIDRFGHPGPVFRAGLKELQAAAGLTEAVAGRIRRKAFSSDPRRELTRVEQLGGRVLTFRDPGYPRALRQIPGPPMVLYLRGLDLPASQDMVTLVGSRTPTPYGVKTARALASELAERGVGVVSGMARGIDAAAHWGALEQGGYTAAVLGTGVDRIYPWANRELFSRILEHGTVLSEFPLGTPPEGRNFPMRNRIVSGLSRGVVVVEAARKSGSLITASLALDQGREVLAVPGSVRSQRSAGCHFLLKQGAALVESADDILEVLGLAGTPGSPIERSEPADRGSTLNPQEKGVYDMLGDDPVHIDEIIIASGMAVQHVLGLLTRLELTGLIEQLPGKMFVRT
ncbi:MAG: DNA-processing protein DprA [Deltaproteobacteria bacterium]|nr:DNA-processing protein DprA [Deltaproteobacteria bacterium]